MLFADSAVVDSVKILTPGVEAPSFSLPSLSGERQALNVWCGKQLQKPYVNKVPRTVILSFWATYCAPCQKEIPELMKFAEAHKKDPIKIFCISLDKEGAPAVRTFVNEKGYTLPVLLDSYKRTAANYGVNSLPALVVIGPDGIIRYSGVGYREDVPLAQILEGAVQAAVEGRNFGACEDPGKTQSVDVVQDNPAVQDVAPRDRWHAIARVECGEDIQAVAGETGVSVDEMKMWYSQLKDAAVELWKETAGKK
jgi:thiol-disulfide isomerase/thioredoxin